MSKNLTSINDDFSSLLKEADKRKIKVPGDDPQSKIARLQSVLADYTMKKTVSSHSLYIDEKGNKSSSKAGFVIQINKKITATYGKPRNEMNADEWQSVSNLLTDLSRIIISGEAKNLLRKKIKENVYAAIKMYGEYRLFVLGMGEVAA